MKKWKVNSWRNYPVKHIPEYKDQEELNVVLGKLKKIALNLLNHKKLQLKSLVIKRG